MDPALKAALDALGMTQTQAIDAQQKAHAEFVATVNADDKKRDALYDDKIAKLQAALDKFEPLSATIAKIEAEAKTAADAKAAADKLTQEQLDRIETTMNRPPAPSEEAEAKAQAKAKQDAFWMFVRKGAEQMPAERKNVLTVADDTTGGYLAPPEYVMDIIKGVVEFSPMRPLLTVRSTSTKSIQYPKRTGVFAAVWVGEIETRSETTGLTWGLEELPVHEMTAESYISMVNLEDSAFNLEAQLKDEFTEQFGVAEGIALITGNGVKKPQGFLNAPVGGGSSAAGSGGTVAVNSGAAASIPADGILDLKYSLKTAYAKNASFVLNRGTLKAIRKLKDGNGQYLWVPGLAVGRPNAIDGDPYTEVVDMPDIGAGNKAMAYGDWKRAMIMADRLQMAIMRDIYTRANVGQIKFVARRRLGAQVVLGEAIAIMTVSA